ncbi:MAG: ABC transporter ATP-binding protein [Elusimicrobiales bacterium]|jgi:ABC-2 type transport system ATP-binding protein|nr:ABC transporter ATP-binding protein [Elusimicrobiales bacterium]
MNGGPALEARDLTIKFGDFTAVDGVTFSVERGEIFGFLGANGAGKTTTIRTLCGLLVPTRGEARVGGLDFSDGGRGIKGKVGYMSQKFTLYNDLTVGENLDFAAGLRKLDPAYARRRREELFSLIAFDRPLSTMVSSLPGGVKQELSLAAAMLHDPEIVFLDEPTAGVSPASRARFWELIREVTGLGKTVLVTTHYMDEAEQCGRIALMRTGKLIALDSPAGLKSAAFPGPMVELDFGGPAPAAALEGLGRAPGLLELSPHGMRWHAAFAGGREMEAALAGLPAGTGRRRIPPSLEDVFIRLVEGAER